ncbi:MAG: alpha,alpha-trehalose-phosphate synthase (UDP-forming) [Rhodospirillaceae bacterium]|nr:alpha,alpha-trehalose-phosphate synthase (UDP-forming) [Rhodospirillaceae bacterium]
MTRLVVVSNRVPSISDEDRTAGGLAVAMRAALKKNGGVWFGWSGEVSENPSPEPNVQRRGAVTHAVIDLSEEDYEEYYSGYSNTCLWPLFHYRLDLFRYDRKHYEGYQRVNAQFARTLLPFIEEGDVVWIQDYHLIPLGQQLRELGVTAPIGFFLHIPVPTPQVMLALPNHQDIMRALCAYDLVGVQTAPDQRALRVFLTDYCGGTSYDTATVNAFGRTVSIGAFPIGIDAEEFASMAMQAQNAQQTRRLSDSMRGRALVIGVDRLDYSKGLIHRFESFERLLAKWPENQGEVSFLQIAPPSRSDVESYAEIRRELEEKAGHINGQFSDIDWVAIRYLNRAYSRRALAGFFRVSRIGLVTPLRDGMNLVAKEYVAAQNPIDPGVLVLSEFAGAAQEMDGALIVNPYDADGVAEAMHAGIAMPMGERRERWQQMFAEVKRNNITVWRDAFLGALSRATHSAALAR